MPSAEPTTSPIAPSAPAKSHSAGHPPSGRAAAPLLSSIPTHRPFLLSSLDEKRSSLDEPLCSNPSSLSAPVAALTARLHSLDSLPRKRKREDPANTKSDSSSQPQRHSLPLTSNRTLSAVRVCELLSADDATDSSEPLPIFWAMHDPTRQHAPGADCADGECGEDATAEEERRALAAAQAELAYAQDALRRLLERRRGVDRHIAALHGYNEMKDLGQMLLGKLAEMEGGITREMYPRFGLDLAD